MARSPIGQEACQCDDSPGVVSGVGRHCGLDDNGGACTIAIKPVFWRLFGRRSFGTFRNHQSDHDIGDAGPELCSTD
jgi:hypothetical protein